MSIRKVYTTLNVRKAESQTTIEGLHVGDVGSTQLVISLSDGTRAIDLTKFGTVAAMIHGKKPDGYEIHNQCDVEGGKILYTLTAQDTAVSGTVYYQLDVLIDDRSGEERCFSPCFRTQVSERVYEPVFRLLDSDTPPEDWAQNYAKYYKKVDDVYVKNNDPTYAADTFYVLVDPPIESASEFQAFWSAFHKVEGLFNQRLIVDYTTLNVGYDADNKHKVFINANIQTGVKGIVFTGQNNRQYAICSDGLFRVRGKTVGDEYLEWEVKALATEITSSNKNDNNLIPSIKAVVDYIAAQISGKADKTTMVALLNDKADKATTLLGYGITDAQRLIDNTHKLSSDLVDDTNKTNKFVTSSEKTTWGNKYDKPSGGIPKTDLSSTVQASLSKADSALQNQDLSGYVTTADFTTGLAGKANVGDIPTVPTNVSAFNNDAGYLTEGDFSNKVSFVDTESNINNCTSPNKIYFIDIGNSEAHEYALVFCSKDIFGDYAQFALTNTGRLLVRKKINDIWENDFTELIPDLSAYVTTSAMNTALAGKADKATTYTKIQTEAKITDDIISKLSVESDGDLVYTNDGVPYVLSRLTDLFYTKTQVDSSLSGKADTATTLAGYGITDGYKRIAVLSSVINNCDNPDTIYFVTVNNPQTSIIPVNDGESVLVLCNKLSANNLIQYGLTLDGRILTRKKVNGTWESKFNDIIPTKTSQLNNDSGFLTEHQDTSGKADKATTLSGYGITDGQTKIDSSHKLSSDLVDDTNKTNKFVTSSEKTSWNGKYSKPSGGIPKNDLASAVQISLGKADSALQSHQDISGKVDKEAGKGLSTNDFTDSDKNLLEAGCTETKNRFNFGTDIILGKNGTGDSSSIRAITVALNTGGGKSVVSVKNLPPNLKYQVWGYNDGNFTSPTNYTTAWIEKRGQSTVVAKPYVRVLFGTVNNATITMADFEGLELQVEEGEQKTDYAPKYTAFDYVARNRSYPVHLKVCSYNVGMYSNGISTDTPAADALENMSGFLGANNFDILGIQEGRSYVNGTSADETVYNDYFISQKSLLNNCAIKSQFVLKDTGEGTFTAGSRKYVYATAIIGNKEVFIINVHLALTATDRASNYTELLALLKAHEYFIVFGDFNAAIDYNTGVEEQTQAEYNNLINAGYTVANGGRWGLLTTIGTQTKYPDNICVSGNIKMITSKTADVYATMNSDHIPIIAELVV